MIVFRQFLLIRSGTGKSPDAGERALSEARCDGVYEFCRQPEVDPDVDRSNLWMAPHDLDEWSDTSTGP